MKFLYFLIFLISIPVYSENKTSILLNYTPIFSSGYLYKEKPRLDKQIGFITNLNDNIFSFQYMKLSDFDTYSVHMGVVFLNKNIDSSWVDKVSLYGAMGFINTSYAGKIYSDTNYPDAIIGFIFNKSYSSFGFGYSYFSGFRFNLGVNF